MVIVTWSLYLESSLSLTFSSLALFCDKEPTKKLVEFVQKCVRVHACTSQRFDPSFDFSNHTPSSAAPPPSSHPPPSTVLSSRHPHPVSSPLMLPRPLSSSAWAKQCQPDQTSQWATLWNLQHTFHRGLLERLVFHRGGEGSCFVTNAPATAAACSWVVSLYRRACRRLVLLKFYSDWLLNGGYLALC